MNKKIAQIVWPAICAVILVTLAAARIANSVWFDESYTAYLIRGDFGEIWNLTAIDVHPPFYYFLLKIWSVIFGTSDVALRMMSVFFAAVAVFLVFFLVKKMFGLSAAKWATVFMVLSPVLIRYAEEMRMYTLVLAIVVGATLALYCAVTSGKKRFWAIYGVLVSLGMWTHYFTALAWIAHVVFLVIYYWKDLKKVWKEILLSYGLALLLFLPWIGNFFKQVGDVSGGFWVPEVTWLTLIDYFMNSVMFVGTEKAWWLVAILGVVVVAIIGLLVAGELRTKKFEKKNLLIELLIILPPILLILLSLPPRTPLFVDRYVMYSAVLLWAFIGIMISKQKKCSIKIIFVGAMVAVAIVGMVNVFNRQAESDIKDLLNKIVVQDGEETVRIATSNESIYYDAVFYDNEKIKVYGVDEFYSYPYGSYAPVKTYRYNLVDKMSDIEGPKWLILDKGAEIKWNYVDLIELDGHKAIKVL